MACLWNVSVGAAELEASRSFPEATSTRLGRGGGSADELAAFGPSGDAGFMVYNAAWVREKKQGCQEVENLEFQEPVPSTTNGRATYIHDVDGSYLLGRDRGKRKKWVE